jgi:DNA helicase HerA-like ATPase
VTTTLAIVGKRDVGKTTTSAVLTEEMLKARLPVVVLDPLDAWFGLRAAADGQGPGFPVTIIGGAHGDVPLEATAHALVADLLVDERLSAVLSLGHLRKGERQRFVTDFAERVYHRKGEDAHRDALHLLIDEADLYAPQRPFAGQARMLGAVDDLVRRGRSSGIGVTVISQRPAAIHKDVLTQLEVLVCHRLVSPQDRKAV